MRRPSHRGPRFPATRLAAVMFRQRFRSQGLVLSLLALGISTANATDIESLVPQLASRIDDAGASAQLGASVGAAGDFNGDGFADVIVGAPGTARGTVANVGAAYVLYGTSVGLPSQALSELTAASGVILTGSASPSGAAIGLAVAGAGDFNGDGRDDVVIGSGIGRFGASQPGTAWIVFGRAGGGTIDLDALGSQGMTLTGAGVGDGFGTVVAGGGSFNGDPRPDVALAAPFGAGLNGEAYVVFGTAAPSASLVMTQLDGLSGTRLQEPESFNLTGVAVSMDGDSNGDGIADLLVGSFGMLDGQQRSVGGAYLVHGRSNPGAVISLGTLAGADGTRFVGPFYSLSVADSAGSAVGFLRDSTGDGRDELVIADPDASPNDRRFSGEVFIVKGSTDFGPSRQLGGLTPADGWRIQGAAGGDKTGSVLTGQADVNRDGRADLAVAAPQTTDSTPLGPGRVAILFDPASGPGVVDLAALVQQRANGELLVGNANGRDFGTLAALCRNACAGGTLAMGAAATDAQAGVVYVLGSTDRIFWGGFE